MACNGHSCELKVSEQVKYEIGNLRDSGHVGIIPFSKDIPYMYLFIAVVGSKTNRKSIDSAGDPVTIHAWTKG